MSRSRHHGCSCTLCKPHKHGLEPKFRPSERCKVQEKPIDIAKEDEAQKELENESIVY